MRILDRIHGHNDLLQLNDQERNQLCQEIREFLIANVSQTGGHLAGNLGIVELSVAIETVYNTMEDRLVFDVGHQSYVHIVESIIVLAAQEINGVAQLDGKQVKIEINGNVINVDVYIKVNFGISCKQVAFRVQENIKNSVETMTDYKVKVVNVNILSVADTKTEGGAL